MLPSGRPAALAISAALVAFAIAGTAPGYRSGGSDRDPSWSPDGRRLAFVHDFYDEDGESSNLMAVRPNGTGAQVLVPGSALGGGTPYDPLWSPDGRTILFGRCCDPDEIWTVGAYGSRLKRLTGSAREPVWSPDGARIAFVERTHLSVMNADGSGRRRLVPEATHPDWSPDGAMVAFAREGDLFVVRVADGGTRRLTETPAAEDYPSWSPDGTLIAYARGFDYRIIEPDGSGDRLLARGRHDVGDEPPREAPAWSPDGSRLALALAARLRAGNGAGLVSVSIHVVRPDGRGLRRATPLSNRSEGHPAWAPDGLRVVFEAQPPCLSPRAGIGVVRFRTRRIRYVTESCILRGTAGADRLNGTSEGDVMYGFEGDDGIAARGDGDIVHGGPGDDRIDGGVGYDDLCDELCDTLRGEPGDDVLVAHDTPSLIDGGRGADTLRGSSRADFLLGGPDPDRIRADAGDDVVEARDRSVDVIFCGRGWDFVAADPRDRVARDCERVRRAPPSRRKRKKCSVCFVVRGEASRFGARVR